jgi:hypothetical protein
MDLNDLQEEINFLSTLKQKHTKRVRIFKLQQAEKGYSCPPETITEIEDIERKIEEINKDIAQKQQTLVNTAEFNEAVLEYGGKVKEITKQPLKDMAFLLAQIQRQLEELDKNNSPESEGEN